MATSRTDIVSETSIAFMRSMDIAFSITNAKPNTKLYAFFDGISVDKDITQTGKLKGLLVLTDSAGSATGTFFVAASKYGTGKKTLRFQDDAKLTAELIPGSMVSTASANFTASGILQSTKTTVTDVQREVRTFSVDNNIIAAPPPPPPPLPAPTSPVWITPDVPVDPAPAPVPVPVPATVVQVNNNPIVIGIAGGIGEMAPPPENYGTGTGGAATNGDADIFFDDAGNRLFGNAGVGGGGGGDPLAQSFFTYGVTGGLTITEIDIYFQAKADNGGVPVTLEIRELVNGYPGPNLVSIFSRVVKLPSDVLISDNAAIATKFAFDVPVYLAENKDFCFVLLSNSDNYFVWTAKFGEKSQETGTTITEQPFIGTMFKSENNITWIADSTEDIKFVIHRAVYNTTGANLVLKAKADKILILGEDITVAGKIVTIKFNYLHGLRNGDKVRIIAPVGLSTYRGVSAAQITGLYSCVYLDEYNISVQIDQGLFTSSGAIDVPGIVNEIQIDSGGSGYTTTPTIAIVGDSTVTATAIVITTDGVITGVEITNHGSGYITKPTIVLTGNGSGASLALISETVIQVETNRVYDEVNARVASFTPISTSLTSTFKSVSSDYLGEGALIIIPNINKVLPSKSILLSDDNNSAFLPGQNPTEFIINLMSRNVNISPIVALSQPPSLECRSYIINNQSEFETISSSVLNGSGSIGSINVNVGGSGYTSALVFISPPNLAKGIQATAVAILVDGVVISIKVIVSGSGYTKPPVVKMIQLTGNPATILPNLTEYNTELLPTGGAAKSRYITKQISLNTVSNGAVIYTNAFSSVNSSFEFYIRTSLRLDNSTQSSLPWRMMNCDLTRNQSIKPNDMFDYTFYINNLSPFDVYELKIILRTNDRKSIPYIDNYRCIILAT